MHCLSLLTIGSFLTVLIVRGSTRRYRHDLGQVVQILGFGFSVGITTSKKRGTPDVHLLRDSWTTFTRLCRRKASVKFITYPTIVEIQSAVSAADQDRTIGAPAGGRRAIASSAVSRCQFNKRFRFQPDIRRR